MRQIEFLFEKPKSEVAVVRKPKDCVGHLTAIAGSKEPLVFLYGENPHLCFVRTHSSDDNGSSWPVMRKEAVRVLEGRGYYHHSNYTSHRCIGQTDTPEKAKVYRFDKVLFKGLGGARDV